MYSVAGFYGRKVVLPGCRGRAAIAGPRAKPGIGPYCLSRHCEGPKGPWQSVPIFPVGAIPCGRPAGSVYWFATAFRREDVFRPARPGPTPLESGSGLRTFYGRWTRERNGEVRYNRGEDLCCMGIPQEQDFGIFFYRPAASSRRPVVSLVPLPLRAAGPLGSLVGIRAAWVGDPGCGASRMPRPTEQTEGFVA